jgi:hypothetical protein
VKELVPFHHDPAHTDTEIDRMTAQAIETTKPAYRVTPGLKARCSSSEREPRQAGRRNQAGAVPRAAAG